MLIANKKFTLGDVVQYTVDYSEHPDSDGVNVIPAKAPIRDGDSITSATVTADKTDVTVASVVVYEGHKVVFKISGGSLNEVFTLTIVVHTDNTETFVDTLTFTVVAP